MPAPLPKSLQDATQDAVDMTRNLAESAGYSSSAVDPTVTVISVERTGLDENGEPVREAADVDDSQETARLTLKTSGSASAPTAVRKDIHVRLVLRMRVNERMNNSLGNMHGGCGATLVDNFTSMVIHGHTSGVYGTPWSFLGVSQNINVFYLNACPVGSVIEMEVYSAQVGKSIAFLTAEFWLVERDDGVEDDGEGPVHSGKWKRTKKTISGTHTKVDNSAQLKI
ncbi:uncharacterized protein UTRI_00180 [Ustilago trichophora]|uniref:Thioesterase domain-containing protein n=1 Tax=Ustilago trichophora TaxID=86804 RepID=A0A5C3DQR7_9BASI|nr:uncharacterized protein UTRI_00180 [Ustilago trichophora]